MIKGNKANKLNTELKDLAQRFYAAYEVAHKVSEDNYKKALAPGQVFHSRQGFYDPDSEKGFKQVCLGFRDRAHGLVDSIVNEIMSLATKAPSEEAVNSISLLASRKNVTAEELDMYMTKYGQDCPLAYKSLKEIAESHGYYDFKDHPLEAQAEYVQILSNSIDNTFDVNRVTTGSAIAAVEGFCANVENAFPTE